MIRTAACFGAAHLDLGARALRPVRPGTSNPVEIVTGLGGVARNVAATLGRLGVPVALVSRLGRDEAAETVLAGAAAFGVDLSFASRSDTRPTARYIAVLEPTGEMAVAVADMAIYDEMTPEIVGPALPALRDRAVWLLDTNLPRDTIAAILDARPAGTIGAVEAVSTPKAEKLRGLLDRIDLLFVNADEAATLADTTEPEAAARVLAAAGVGTVVVNLGPAGAGLLADGAWTTAPAAPAAIVDVTGAGDGSVGGYLCGLLAGRSPADCLRLGRAAAALALESADAVPRDLDLATLFARAGMV
jgi:pseudouridine kinase